MIGLGGSIMSFGNLAIGIILACITGIIALVYKENSFAVDSGTWVQS